MSSTEADLTPEQARAFSSFLPLILGLSAAVSPPSDETQIGVGNGGDRVVIINPGSGSVVMIHGMGMMNELNKESSIPASKASIEAMPAVKITEEGSECAICLTEYEIGGEAKEMPCKHRYHSGCIEKWLGIHGSCPVCRYKMPVEEVAGEGEGEGGRRGDFEISIYVRTRRESGGSGSDDGGVTAAGGSDSSS